MHHRLVPALLGAVAALSAAAADLPDLIDRTKPSIVGVGTRMPMRRPPNDLTGTGFVVGDGTLVVTNDHVVNHDLDASRHETIAVFVAGAAGAEQRAARVVARDPEHDLALLAFEGDAMPALALAEHDTVREGDEVFFTGFPIGAVLGLYPVTHRGMIAAIVPTVIPQTSSRTLTAAQIRRLREPFEVLQLDAIAYPGNSGSPVMGAKDGRVIGIVNSVYVKRTKEHVLSEPSGISYAIPVAHVRALLGGVR